MRSAVSVAFALLLVVPAAAQYGDIGDLKLLKPEDKDSVKSAPPPKGAHVLFDGKDLDQWVFRNDPKKPAAWKMMDGGAMQVQGGDIITKEKFDSQEGFVLSRVNGQWDLRSILKLCPLPEDEALMIFVRLLDRKVIELQ